MSPRSPILRLILILCVLAAGGKLRTASAQTPRDFAIDLAATVSASVPRVTLTWTQRRQSNITAQKVYRRLKGEVAWNLLATLGNTDTSYADSTAAAGVEYEYWMQRTYTGISPATAMGYLSAGVGVPMVEARGKLLLVVDSTMVTPLAPEIAQLQADLAADGWVVQTITATRTDTAANVKAQILAAYNADPVQMRMVYLLGHVPVPYSGNIAPDGHSDHVGAWPADGYYGDMDGAWTDATVNNTTASSTRNDNVPGDGKFDQSTLPSALELAVGRVDLHTMQRAPSTVVTETALLRRYLRKAHDYRHRLGAYASVPRRALVRDGFGYFSGENFATSGWAWAFTASGRPPTMIVDEPPSGQWWSYAASNTYLIGYGCGGGSYESASTVGSTTDFGRLPSKVVFTSLFGSYHGDWDANNNFMRAPLAGNATGDSLGLACFWAGRPHYFMHHTGMGETLGYAVRHSQNGGLTSVSNPALTPGGSSFRGVHTGLMGDPALRLHMVEPPRQLAATSASGSVSLAWAASTEPALIGYHVYRGSAVTGPFTRLTASPLLATAFVDASGAAGQTYTYLVRTLKTESAPGGTYENPSVGSAVTITVNGGASSAPANPAQLAVVSQTSGTSAQLAWSDNATDETGYRVERRTNAAGSWSTAATLAAGTTAHTDAGPFTQGNVYYYRVIATGAAGDSAPSNEVSFDAVAGFIEMAAGTKTVNKTDGSAVFTVQRFGGAVGPVSVSYATSSSSAIAGTHFTTTNGTLTWADGDTAAKTITVPIINTAAPQQARQFKVTLSSPTGGAGFAAVTVTSCLILDPSATVPSPWTSSLIGSVTYSAPAIEAEGAIGSTLIGGSGASSGSTSEAGRFVQQTITGDGSMTVFVPAAVPAQGSSRYALMARANLTGGSVMAAAVASSDAANFGAKLVYRATASAGASVLPSASNSLVLPRWLRLTRSGDVFTAETSSDGSTWTVLGTASVTMPAAASWGLFHFSSGLSASGTGDYQLAQFQTITTGGLPAPGAATGLTATFSSGGASPATSLAWNGASYASSYRLERRVEGGAFAEIATLGGGVASHQDTAVSLDTAYEYRLRATNSTGDGPWSSVARVCAPPADITRNIAATGAGGADSMIRASAPAMNHGADTTVTVCGSQLGTGDLSTVAKTWLRFDLTGVPQVRSARLRLFLASHDLQPTFDASGFFYCYVRLLTEASDTWDESAIHWNNAPQNDLAGLGTTGTITSPGAFGFFSAAEVPATGGEESVPLTASTLSSGVGANGLVTLALVPYGQSGPVAFASDEHAAVDPPMLEIVHTASQVKPSFLTASAAAGSINLAWADNSASETGYLIERRALGGVFTPLSLRPADATAFSDTSVLPGVIYEYRARATGSPSDSSWSLPATATASGTPTAYQLWLQAQNLPMDGSGAGAPDASPNGDGVPNLEKYALGLAATTQGTGGRIFHGTAEHAGAKHLTITYIRPEPAPSGIIYAVEASGDLAAGGWSSAGLVEVSNSVAGGLRTITMRDSVPSTSGAARFMRLKVTAP